MHGGKITVILIPENIVDTISKQGFKELKFTNKQGNLLNQDDHTAWIAKKI